MTSPAPNPTFENVTQRVAFSYQRQMPEFVPVLPDSLSQRERDKILGSQKELDAFYRAFYRCAFEQPAKFGLPATEDVCIKDGFSKEQKQDVTKRVKKARDKLAAAVHYLYHVGQNGTPIGAQLYVDQAAYALFFAKSPRVKGKLVQGMQAVGLTVSRDAKGVLISNTQYPHMMLALQPLAMACAQRDDDKLAAWLFARCDLNALDATYQPGVQGMLHTALSAAEYERAIELHHTLAEIGYKPSLEIAGVHNWRIRYQGNRAIKGTALLEFEYDEREQHPLRVRVKCASTNRLVPLLSQQPELLQRDFYRHAHACGAPKCSWCKTRPNLGPSVLEQEGEKRTICWWMQRHFVELNRQAVDLVKQYALLHQALLSA